MTTSVAPRRRSDRLRTVDGRSPPLSHGHVAHHWPPRRTRGWPVPSRRGACDTSRLLPRVLGGRACQRLPRGARRPRHPGDPRPSDPPAQRLPANAPPLPFPHTSQVDGPLRELRCHYGSQLYRVLYQRSDNLFVLLHMFRKDRGKIAAGDIEVAKARWEDFRKRMDAEPRVPPRAAGHDAP